MLAVGEHADLEFLKTLSGVKIGRGDVVEVDAHMSTGHPGVFAGGDMIGGARTMTAAVGHGKKAARNIDAWLRGEVYAPEPKHADRPLRRAQPAGVPRRRSARAGGNPGRTSARASRRSSPDSPSRKRATRRAAACRAATVSSATTATRRVRSRRSSSSARAASIATTTTFAPAARCASSSVRAMRSRWSRNPRQAAAHTGERDADEVQGAPMTSTAGAVA